MHKDKVVILLAENHEDIYELFPALFYLNSSLVEPQINIISDKDFNDQLSHLPFKTINFAIDKKDLGLVGSFKLAHKLQDIFNVTHFYNFRDGMGAANFGRSLKAKNNFKALVNQTFLDVIADDVVDKVSYHEGEKLPENFFKSQTHDPFLFIAMSDLSEDDRRFILVKEILSELTDLKDQRIIMWTDELNAHHLDLLSSFPQIINASEVGYQQIHHYILTCKGIFTDRLDVARLSSYIGVDHFLLSRKDYRNSLIPEFPFVLSQLNFDNEEIRYTEGAEQLKEMKKVHEIMDLIHEKFNL